MVDNRWRTVDCEVEGRKITMYSNDSKNAISRTKCWFLVPNFQTSCQHVYAHTRRSLVLRHSFGTQMLANPPFAMLLNPFAGQLYLKTYDEYLLVCRFLGLGFRPPYEQIQVACNGFISPTSKSGFDALMESVCPFTISPVEFLRILMALRRKGQSFQKSHLGRILHWELLARDEFQG